MHKYRLISKKGEGTFSEVLKAQSVKNGQYVAIKCMKNHFQSIDQVNNLREIQALKRLNPHSNIVRLHEVLFDKATGRLALVFELMDMNIYELIRGRKMYLSERRIRLYMYQLLKAMAHMHQNGIFHRDIKPENILIRDEKLKVADFGSCRGIYSKGPFTEYISTRWYRAPECLLTDGHYDYRMDIWGVGCVFFEIVSLFPLFPGKNELDQIERIHNVFGTPDKTLITKFKKYSSNAKFDFPKKKGAGICALIPHAAADCVDLIQQLLTYDFEERLTARQGLCHPYFREIVESERQVRHGSSNLHISSRGSNTTVDTSRSSKDENYLLSHTTSVPAFEQLKDKKKHKKRDRKLKRKNDCQLPTINGIHRYKKNNPSSTNEFGEKGVKKRSNGLPVISKKLHLNPPPKKNNIYKIQLRQNKKKKKKKSYQTKYRY